MADAGWTVSIDATSDVDATDAEIEQLVELFRPYGGALAIAGGRFGATFSIEGMVSDNRAPGLERVATRGVQIFREQLRAIGREDWTIVRLDVRTFAEQDRPGKLITARTPTDGPRPPESSKLALTEATSRADKRYSAFPAGFTVPMHTHDHNEVIVCMSGSLTMLGDAGPTLRDGDSMVLIGGYESGFTAGPDGMSIMTIRTAVAGTTLTP